MITAESNCHTGQLYISHTEKLKINVVQYIIFIHNVELQGISGPRQQTSAAFYEVRVSKESHVQNSK